MRHHLSLSIALIALATTAAACASEPPRVTVHTDRAAGGLVVTGSATLNVRPDCADLTMTVTASADRPAAAVDQVHRRQAELLAALDKLGVARADVALSTMSVQPDRQWIEQRSVLKGYDARVTLTVTTRAFDQLGPLMEAGAAAGVTEMYTQLRRSDLDGLKKQVRERALLAARDKARQTAATLDVSLGPITAVAEQSASYLFSNAYFPRVPNVQETQADGGAALAGELQPLTVDVTLTYQLPGA